MFQSHIRFLSENYPVALPGDPLTAGKITVCLTFDDAYFDFYHYVFPLLCELKIKALLAVPVKYIIERTTVDDSSRLQVPCDEAMNEGVYQEKAPFCTWTELTRMADSGHVEVASHSYSHIDLSGADVDLNGEVAGSKAILEEKLHREITTFVYPFGKFDRKAQSMVSRHYRFSMRIGAALNKDWHNSHGVIYRVAADSLPDPKYPVRRKNLAKYFLKYISNTIRGR